MKWAMPCIATLPIKTQPHPKARYSIFVAEVASTLNEGLLLHHLLGKATEKGAASTL